MASRVAVIGGGIMGASVAWHLARSGAHVSLVDRDLTGQQGVTAASYGWIGTGDHSPSDDPAGFALRLRAMAEFDRLERALGPLPVAARGAISWRRTEAETVAWVAERRAEGARVESLGRAAIAEHEPRLARPPALAAWTPNDLAVEAGTLTRLLIADASGRGATLIQHDVQTIEALHGRVTGVGTAVGSIPADIVVLANGTGAVSLAQTVGVELPITKSPAVLIRLAAEPGLVRHLLYGDDIELRPGLDGGLVSAADYPAGGQDCLAALACRTAVKVAGLLGLSAAPLVLSVSAAHRPMTGDGQPLRGFINGIEGLYALVAHPGVILAPLLGRLAAQEIIRGTG